MDLEPNPMDISSLPEAEQQQLQQLHQQFKEHQAQQQQNQIQPPQQQHYAGDYSYYPQSYDYSSYYQQQQQQHYAYYPQQVYDYSAYQQPLPHHQAESLGVATKSVPNAGQHSGMMHYGPGSMPLASGSQYRGGGGRRGRGSFRGGAHGNFGHRNLSSGGSGPPNGGKGRNKAKGVAKPKVLSSTGNIGPSQQPARALRCEICEVECNSLEILENHKNGKKHKKNVLRIEVPNKFPKPSTEIQNMEQLSIGPEPKENCQSDNTQEAENGNPKAENVQPPQNSTVGPTELTVENGKRGVKRKLTTGGKKNKARKMEPPKQPKVVIPIVCDLCNVKCDTRDVFEKHLAGKKHIGKLKRFEGHQNMFGPMGLQALYPPNPIAQNGPPQHSVYGTPHLPTTAYAPPQSYHAVGPTVAGGSDPYNPFNPVAVVASEAGSQNGALLTPNG